MVLHPAKFLTSRIFAAFSRCVIVEKASIVKADSNISTELKFLQPQICHVSQLTKKVCHQNNSK
ncbi:hypothetical protein NIES22_42220 [Calothrix brevissima NIES-22]|nr:hypothetical protein NIES22_42220 [Calothrix brevissima NIES-22]